MLVICRPFRHARNWANVTAPIDAHSLRYAQQAQTRHPVTATVLQDSFAIPDNVAGTVSA